MSSPASILVVGSVNMDLVVRTPHIPAPGETVLGDDFVTNPGGKGANQAVAAARLGARCRMIGRVGDDAFGRRLIEGLQDNGVDCGSVAALPGRPSGVAMIAVADDGENAIVVASGANFLLTPDDIRAEADAFADADVVVCQLELPLPTVVATIEQARRCGRPVILDPAPAPAAAPAELFEVDVISPNVSEAGQLLPGVGGLDDEQIAAALCDRGAAAAVLKLGSRGSLVYADGRAELVGPFGVDVVDTTAAGDTFTAALAVAAAEGAPLVEAARFANAAGALACTRIGAQQAAPTRQQVQRLVDAGAGGG